MAVCRAVIALESDGIVLLRSNTKVCAMLWVLERTGNIVNGPRIASYALILFRPLAGSTKRTTRPTDCTICIVIGSDVCARIHAGVECVLLGECIGSASSTLTVKRACASLAPSITGL